MSIQEFREIWETISTEKEFMLSSLLSLSTEPFLTASELNQGVNPVQRNHTRVNRLISPTPTLGFPQMTSFALPNYLLG